MYGGNFVGNEWLHTYGVKIYAEGHDGRGNLHPMIFDSSNVENNVLGNNIKDKFSLGSPNVDCGGFGVGMGGRAGQSGENCRPLGNILIPSRRPGSPETRDIKTEGAFSKPLLGGVLIFEFHKWTRVNSVEMLNIMEDSEILATLNNGNSAQIGLVSVGQNGFQSIAIDLENVRKLYFKLNSFTGVVGMDLCILVDNDS